MTDLCSTLQMILQQAGYQTWLASVEKHTVVCFEDMAVMGFACIFDDTTDLLGRWRSLELSILNRYAPRLREAEDKAWNIYTAFLTSTPANETQRRELRQIEEDLERTRKLAASGLTGHEEVVLAILPVLPIQYRPQLESDDLTERLLRRIATIAPAAADIALDDAVTPSEVVRQLGAAR